LKSKIKLFRLAVNIILRKRLVVLALYCTVTSSMLFMEQLGRSRSVP